MTNKHKKRYSIPLRIYGLGLWLNVECLHSMHEPLGSISSTEKKMMLKNYSFAYQMDKDIPSPGFHHHNAE